MTRTRCFQCPGWRLVWLAGALLSAPLLNAAPLPGQAAATSRVRAGAYYFDGWTGKTDPIHLPPRLREEFADREPVWGWRDDSLPIVEQQIDYAADHGLAFFAFDWYWPEGPDKQTPLNTALALYHQARNKQRLQFCLLVANHGGFRIGPADWEAVTELWVRLFREPMHLKVGGKPLLIFFAPRELRQAFGSAEAVNAAFDRLDAKARDAGLEGLCVAACTAPGPTNNPGYLTELKAEGYCCLTGYNYPRYLTKGPDKIQPFSRLIEGHEQIWSRFAADSPLPYIPVVTTGWDKRPWEDPARPETHEVYYPDRTPVQVADFVARTVTWLDAHPDKTPKERILLLYAWNENGEGGYLTPTKGLGAAYLKAVSKVLNRAAK